MSLVFEVSTSDVNGEQVARNIPQTILAFYIKWPALWDTCCQTFCFSKDIWYHPRKNRLSQKETYKANYIYYQ